MVLQKENKKNSLLDSMVDISYQILYQNKESMKIEQLIKKVFEIKKIDLNNKEKISQLYLDIILSGRFVFLGNDLWDIKTSNNLNLWDQDYFIDSKAKEEEIGTNDIEKEILDLDDLEQKKDDNIEIEDDKELEEKLDLNIDPENLDVIDEDLELDDIDKNKNNEKEEFIDEEEENDENYDNY
ncbi:MAG: DNA-directed RNA polymerase subunit delta [Candidatus Phytoplasma stylosanthis]|uniref:DNA-directed RNA polymerase subunit delta n=2 Tax=Candidatus Phytoplasma stylosanthis TaxID=2798314 RepID=UPI00293A187C|nr:DNA-directed RNA polymerase subunit delta [Candidatus Phytoplasma stylosanthis]MDV3170989.1 DNA-directed RNA polymerase subunit delta [Candidatus Phytoplasma stylosanthis]MDV3173770.1 DNA-directed RNA polymerase subunit delta [Candidatus Phytoplasma stylosanthis]MDV3174305.1 DNA-directed RNA polymerase subunit delta [Candidatus Phytoplasma stylosanthis]MDV3202488.1 DNA-directed RNA polymerase subunit delta [Candidatus Phytoplasma stylosanthis]